MNLDVLSKRVHDLLYEFENEDRLTRVGLKDRSDGAAVFAKYPDLYDQKTIEFAKAEKDKRGSQAERWRRLYQFCQDIALERSSIKLHDKLQNDLLSRTVTIDGQKIPYFALRGQMVNEPDSKKREEIYAGESEIVDSKNLLRQNILKQELRELAEQTDSKTITEYLTKKKNVNYPKLLKTLQSAMQKTDALYEKHLGAWVKRDLGMELGAVSRAHQGYLMKVRQFDGLFPLKDLLLVCKQTFDGIGCSFDQLPQIHVDDIDRPQKNPRAACYAPDPPKEVHLIIKPVGGMEDYHTFLHEAGHALHFALIDPKLPYELRALSTSHALTEVYSFLIESLARTPSWLRHYLGVDEGTAMQVEYMSTLSDLLMFRRYVGKLEYELGMNEDPVAWHKNSNNYVKILTRNTGFIYTPERYLDDVDAGLYSADYLRAWITAAQVRSYLHEKWGDEWFLSSKAGEFLRSLWAKGVSIENEDVSREIGFTPFDTSTLLAEYEHIIGRMPLDMVK